MKTIRHIAVALALAGLAAPAFAQIAPPGWYQQAGAREFVATSLDQGRGLRVKLIYKAAVAPHGSSLDLWFPDAHLRAAREHGEVMSIGKVQTLEQPYLSRLVAGSITVKPKTGGRLAIAAYAYDTEQGRGMTLIVLPATLGKLNPAYKAAFAAMNDFWRSNQVYVPKAAPAS
jgi:hypothetical protein